MRIDHRPFLGITILVAATALAACGGSADRISTADTPSGDPTSSTSTTPGYPDPDASTSSTTSTSTSTTTTTSTAPAPAAPLTTQLALAGTHRGIEHFALGTGRCPQIDHHLDETFTLTDGTALTFASAYCGTIDATGRWSGAGTYTLTGAAGSFHGRTISSVAHVPSPGGPYTLAVDDGTGAYAGTTGSCAVEEHLEIVHFGEQRHWGNFTCTLDIPTTPAPGS
jgi:hypothetical protein